MPRSLKRRVPMYYYHNPLHHVSKDSFLNRLETIQVQYRRLPHWDVAKLQFITFRLADSIPQSKLKEFMEQKQLWLERHPKPWSNETLVEYSDVFGDKIDKWLDSNMGECILRDPLARDLFIKTLLYKEGEWFDIVTFCIMPNHIHLLLNVYGGVSVKRICRDIKRISSHRINKMLGRSGHLWMEESFDRVIRSEKHLFHVLEYIRHNGDGLNDTDFTVMKGY